MTWPLTVSVLGTADVTQAVVARQATNRTMSLCISNSSRLLQRGGAAECRQRPNGVADIRHRFEIAPHRTSAVALFVGDVVVRTDALKLVRDFIVGHRGVHFSGRRIAHPVERV